MSTPISSSSSTTSSAGTTGATSTGTTGSTNTTSSAISGGSASQPFQIFGLASGLDTNSIITKLVAVYTAPMQLVQAQQATTVQEQSAWNDVQTKLTTLQTAIQTLQSSSSVSARVGATTPPAGVGQTAAVSITASPTAALGNFTVNVQSLATTGSLAGAANISAPITNAAASSTALVNTGFAVTPTTGTVTINGQQITIDAGTTLLSAGTGNSLQEKLTAIGVTLTPTITGGNVTGVTLSAATPLQLGATGDTSNILTALRLNPGVPQGSPPDGKTIANNGALTGNSLSTALPSLKLATALTSTAGTFTVNGVSISYTATDTLGSIIGKINNSAAGVTATYDALSDRMVLTANTTGAGAIGVADTSSNLMAALKLTTAAGATSTPGLPTVFTVSGVNGGNPIASATNTVTNVVPGVTLNLLATSPSMTAAGATTVTVTQDVTALTNSLQSFVKAYNDVQDTITKYTGIQLGQTGSNGPQSAGLLAGDPTLSGLAQTLDETVNDTSVTINGQQFSMAALGVSTGVVGSYNATTVPSLDLQFDSTKVAPALSANSTLAQAFIGNGSVSSQSGTLFQNLYNAVNSFTSPLGIIGTTLDTLTTQYTNQQDQIQQWQDFANQQRQQLVDMYTNMETSLAQIQQQGQSLLSALGATTSSTSSGKSG